MYVLWNALRIKGLNLIFWHGLPCGWLCLRTRFRLSHGWNLTLWFLNITIQNSAPTQVSQKFFMHCRLPTKLNIRKGSLPAWWSNHLSENLSLSLKDIVVGILIRKDILNYLIILGKLCVWDCRRKNRSQSSSFWKPRRNYHVPSAIEKEGTAGIIKAFSRRDLHLKWSLLDKATTLGFVRKKDFRSKIFPYIGVQFFRHESK